MSIHTAGKTAAQSSTDYESQMSSHALSLYPIVYIRDVWEINVMRLKFLNLVATTVIVGLCNEPVVASEKLLAGTPKTVHKKFNLAAKEFRSKQRMVLTECSGDGVQICNYTVTGQLALMAWSREGHQDRLESVTLIYAKGSNAMDMFIAMGTLMQVDSPGADKSERGVAIATLAEGIKQEAGKKSVILDDVTYSVSNLGKMGLWFTVKAQ